LFNAVAILLIGAREEFVFVLLIESVAPGALNVDYYDLASYLVSADRWSNVSFRFLYADCTAKYTTLLHTDTMQDEGGLLHRA
jgi:hypothetical protein